MTIIGQLCEIQMDRVVQHHCIPQVSLPRCSEGAMSGCTGRPRRRRVLSGENGRIPFFSLCRRGTNGLDLGIKLIPSFKNDKSVTQTNTGHEYHGTRKFFTTRAARLSQPVGLVPGPPLVGQTGWVNRGGPRTPLPSLHGCSYECWTPLRGGWLVFREWMTDFTDPSFPWVESGITKKVGLSP